ncbi:MAG: hypothetical protein ACFFF4_11595 [Candidatus Thorarchaeota archaeon]
MDEVVLDYDTTKGHISEDIKLDTKVLKLGKKKIQSLSLDSLSSLTHLRQLWVNDNELASLDLSPLSHCLQLEILSISGNNLQSIDLTPLKYCHELEKLYLHDNGLESINLEPLRNTKKLSMLFLDRNRLKRVQLDPLFDSQYLSEIRLWKNLMPSVDVTPLFFIHTFRTLHFEADKDLTMDITLKYLSEKMDTNRFLTKKLKFNTIEWLDYTSLSVRDGWSGVRTRLLEIIDRTDEIFLPALVEGFFESFGLPAQQNWNIDLKDILLSIPEDISYGEAVKLIEQKLGFS